MRKLKTAFLGFVSAGLLTLGLAASASASTGIPAFDVNGATFTTHSHVFVNENLTWNGRPETVTDVQHYPGESTVFQVLPRLPKAQNGHHVLFLPDSAAHFAVTVASYGPTGGLHKCSATSITCQSDSVPPVPGWV
jgi:hypothetical protein